MRYNELRLAYQLGTPARSDTARSSREMPRSGSLVCAAIMPNSASAEAFSGAAARMSLQMPAASPNRFAWAAACARFRAWSAVSPAAGGGATVALMQPVPANQFRASARDHSTYRTYTTPGRAALNGRYRQQGDGRSAQATTLIHQSP